MNKQKGQMNILCLTGFILSLLAAHVVLFFGVAFSNYRVRRSMGLMVSHHTEVTILNCSIGLGIVAAILGLIFSIKGLASCRNRNEKGKGLSITGIVYSGILLITVSLFQLAVCAIPRESPPTGTTPAVNELIREED